MRSNLRVWAAVAAVIAVMGLSACGDDDDAATTDTTAGGTATTAGTDTTAAGEAGGDEVAKAEEVVAPFLEPATSINIDVPLTEKPPAGIKVGWLEGNAATITVITPGFQEATEALGWELVTVGYDVTDPQSANSAMQQAVDQGVDYLAITGLNTPSYETGLAAAKAANIPLVQMDIAREEGALEKGAIACVACDEMVEEWGVIMGNWIIADSGADANVAYVTIPEFSSLIPEGEALQETLSSGCEACEYSQLDTTISAFASGGIAGEVASYVQSNPDVNYLYFAFGGMAAGSREALDSAGIGENVKIVTADPDLTGMQDIIDGKHSAGVNLSVEGHAWVAVDAMARHSVGMDPLVTEEFPIPTQIYTQENIPQPAELYHGAEGYQDQFKKIWLVDAA